MGLTGWQSGSWDKIYSPIDMTGDDNIVPPSNYQTDPSTTYLVMLLGLVALGLLAPELIPALLAEFAAEGAGAGVAADLAGTAADASLPVDVSGVAIDTGEPGYVTWAKNVVADPGSYSEDNLGKAEQILLRNKLL